MAGGGSIVELNRCRTAWSRLKGGGLGRAMAPARILNLVLSDVPGQGPELVASGPTVVAEAETLVVGDNLRAQRATGLQLGVPAYLEGEARDAGAHFYAGCGEAARVAGGETTVTVRGPGRGGRNQEFVLGALASGYRGGLLLSLGTDGTDGPSSLAGALLDEAVVAQAAAQGLDPAAVLEANDSESFFRKAGGGIETGPIGTNVADLVIYLP